MIGWFEDLYTSRYAQAALVFVVGMLLTLPVGAFIESQLLRAGRVHAGAVTRKLVRYGGAVVLAVTAAEIAGYDLRAVLATAGILGVAVGFAAQTSLSNLIAGLFLLLDRPFEVGDIVETDGRIGIVHEMRLLSTMVRTFDNLLVRWPNEVILKARIVNYTAFPVRRLDLPLRIPSGSDIPAVMALLVQTMKDSPLFLLEPAPEVRLVDLQANGVTLELRAWLDRDLWIDGRDALIQAVHDALHRAGVPPIVPAFEVHKRLDPHDAPKAP